MTKAYLDGVSKPGGFKLRQLGYTSLALALITGALAGILLYSLTNSKILLSQDYTLCTQLNSDTTCDSILSDKMVFDKPVDQPCRCRLDFELSKDEYFAQVNIYYGIKNLYQNYRFLTFSRDTSHLMGSINDTLAGECQPSHTSNNKTVFPCGSLANVLFDDEFILSHDGNTTLEMDRYNIPLEKSRTYQYRNPPDSVQLKQFDKPPHWQNDLWSMDPSYPANNGVENGNFIVWMTVSTFQNFYKLYSIIRPAEGVMRKGRYKLEIIYRYGVHTELDGTKFVLIQSVGAHGVRNTRLIIILLVISLIYISLFIITLLFWKRWAFHAQDLAREL